MNKCCSQTEMKENQELCESKSQNPDKKRCKNPEVQLFQPPLLDFSKLSKDDDVKIAICNQKHKFATDADYSGTDSVHQPIFGSKLYINGKRILKTSFGLP